MKTKIFIALLCWLAVWQMPARAQSDSASDFIRQAKKMREDRLAALEPRVMLHPAGRTRATRVVAIGDSLSVGAFGESIGNYLTSRFGQGNVALFAAGGSSPQSWMSSEPDYVTKCGYREQTVAGTTLIDFVNGRRPRPVCIPKIETLIRHYHPSAIVVQLGTNWMDGLALKSNGDEYDHDRAVMDRFIAVLRSHPGEERQIVWIMPPDSAKFSGRVQRAVESLIRDAARKYSFEVVASRSMTHYVVGKSGGDGVHYNSEPSQAWARLVAGDLDRKLH